MSPELSLHFAGIFLSYFLKVAAAYLACWLLNRLLRKPQQRFLMWMVFLLGAGTYWLALIFRELRALPSPTAGAGSATPGMAPAAAHSFLVPLGWSHALLLAGQVLALAYGSAGLLLMGMAAWRHLRLRLLLRRAMQPSEALAGLFRETSRACGVSRCHLLVLPGLRSPATACWWNPRILLPEVCEELGPTPQLADVLCHELVHVARRDYFWAGLTDLICRLLFFHPAAWKAGKWMRLQGELACDLAVVEARPGHRADYADSLAYFVRLRMLQDGVSLGVDFAASASSLGMRIRTILAAPQPMPWWKRISQMAAGLALAGGLAILAPALTILLDFARPVREQTGAPLPAQTAAERARNTRRAHRHEPVQPPNQDSLTSLRMQPALRETPVYTLTVSGNGRDVEPGDPDTPAWRESNPSARHPTVSSVVLSTLGQIVGARIPRGREHDRDDH